MRKSSRLMVLLLSLTLLTGCALAWIGVGAGLGVGSYKYIDGNVVWVYPLAYDTAWDVTNKALANLYISITNSMNDGSKGSIEAVQKDGKKVIVRLENKGQNITDISIRVGFWGNRLDAEKIHEEIKTAAGLK